ncbi:hypothetical protein [Phaffia rhodozyma]|uniref:Transcription elongation factor Eaf N-terminal domain-containing protein n=1 Tax=Phaffia rhodozyma TaxID=264483 RepID=A0A0F7SHJ5_PHARH|nr:hypothetical protein [Phaffia rhodozyma]
MSNSHAGSRSALSSTSPGLSIPTTGRHKVVLDPAMIRALVGSIDHGAHSQGDEIEYDAFKYKFKPSSILTSKPGTITPTASKDSSSSLSGSATVHLQGPLEGEVHGFAAKVESEGSARASGRPGSCQNDHLAVLKWDGKQFSLLPISKTYSLVHDKSLALDSLPVAHSPPPQSERAYKHQQPSTTLISSSTEKRHRPTSPPSSSAPATRDVHMSSSASSSRSSSPEHSVQPRPTVPALPSASQPRPTSKPPLSSSSINPSLPTRPTSQPSVVNPDVEILSFPTSSISTSYAPMPSVPAPLPARPMYGGKSFSHSPLMGSPTIPHPQPPADGSSDDDDSDSSESEGEDDDDDFAAQLKQELAGVSAGGKKAGKGAFGVVGGKGLGLGLGTGHVQGAGKRPVSLNSLMGVEDDDLEQESPSSDED